MTIAAIYARKSTEQKGVAEDSKSVALQEEHARAFAATKGWIVRDEHVYVDDGISGAEFERRPGIQRLLRAADREAFQVVIVADQSRLGREQYDTQALVKRLAQHGVAVWAYLRGALLTPRNAMDKAVLSIQAFGDEAHREASSEKAFAAALTKHQRGHIAGGRVFGYRNVDVMIGTDAHGRQLRSHVERVVDDAEAATVRRIFELFAQGYGLKRIAALLTAEGAAAPKPFVRKDAFGVLPVGGWVPSTIRGVIAREDYKGVYVWNKTKKRDDWGAIKQRPRPESEWRRTSIPEWQIVSDDLWNTVAERRKAMEQMALRFNGGRLVGRPPKNGVTNLLAGLATCAVCGGGLVVETYKSTKGKSRKSHYVCNRRRANGKCDNDLRISVEDVNEALLQAVEEHALTPEAIEHVIQLTELDERKELQVRLERERAEVDRKICRIVAAIEDGHATPSVLQRLPELEARKATIANELAGLRPVPRLPIEVVESRLAEWRRLLRGSVTQGRLVLERVLAGRIVFTPTAKRDGYTFTAPTRFDKLFSGLAVPCPAMWRDADATGTEGIRTDETWDGDYERLLEKAHATLMGGNQPKRLASPPGFEPGFQP
jgi:site-specific DNA recombinase